MSETDNKFAFPKSLKYQDWVEYLGRSLNYEEKSLIEDCRSEKHLNDMLNDLYKQCINTNYYVPILTDVIGNCLFESLVYYKIGSSVEELRTMLSMIFYIFQDYKNFLPGMSESLSELFSFSNEIEYVSTKNKTTDEKEFYKYTYTIMCQDLGNFCCWSRLPTQLILLVVSYLYKVEIIILHSDNGHETKINAYDTQNIKTSKIYLGLLGESHYVPIDILDSEEEMDPMYYTSAQRKLIHYGTFMQKCKIQNYAEIQEHQLKMDNNFTPLKESDLNNDLEVDF